MAGGRATELLKPIDEAIVRMVSECSGRNESERGGSLESVLHPETLRAAYDLAKRKDGAPGIDGVTFDAIEAGGLEGFLAPLFR